MKTKFLLGGLTLIVIAAMLLGGMVNSFFTNKVEEVTNPAVAATPVSVIATAVKEAKEILQPTPTVRPSSGVFLSKVKAKGFLVSAEQVVKTNVIIEANSGDPLLAYAVGKRINMKVVGTVYAGVDLSALTEQDIYWGEDDILVIRMPAAKMLDTALNEEETGIVTDESGLFTRFTDIGKGFEDQARARGKEEITRYAVSDSILTDAAVNAQQTLMTTIFQPANIAVRFEYQPQPTQPAKDPLAAGNQYRLTTEANLRDGPTGTSQLLGYLPPNTVVTIIRTDKGDGYCEAGKCLRVLVRFATIPGVTVTEGWIHESILGDPIPVE